jgi:hypothetical protein
VTTEPTRAHLISEWSLVAYLLATLAQATRCVTGAGFPIRGSLGRHHSRANHILVVTPSDSRDISPLEVHPI